MNLLPRNLQLAIVKSVVPENNLKLAVCANKSLTAVPSAVQMTSLSTLRHVKLPSIAKVTRNFHYSKWKKNPKAGLKTSETLASSIAPSNAYLAYLIYVNF